MRISVVDKAVVDFPTCPWRNVCDGKFTVSGDTASMISSKANMRLKKISEDKFELSWTDKRWGVSGLFKLTREN